jgi:hypothetical protein
MAAFLSVGISEETAKIPTAASRTTKCGSIDARSKEGGHPCSCYPWQNAIFEVGRHFVQCKRDQPETRCIAENYKPEYSYATMQIAPLFGITHHEIVLQLLFERGAHSRSKLDHCRKFALRHTLRAGGFGSRGGAVAGLAAGGARRSALHP